jgi:hypothetical protein
MKNIVAILLSTFLLMACTTTGVGKIDATKYPLKLICIEEKTEVKVEDLLLVLENAFQRRNIQTTIYRGNAPEQCVYTLWYTAFRGWDIGTFLRHFELRIRRNGVVIASAAYNHSGGLALNKWANTESKLTPVLDELLADFPLIQRP